MTILTATYSSLYLQTADEKLWLAGEGFGSRDVECVDSVRFDTGLWSPDTAGFAGL